jgi:hypothetical protein
MRVVRGIGVVCLLSVAVYQLEGGPHASAAPDGRETGQCNETSKSSTTGVIAKTLVMRSEHEDSDFYCSHLVFARNDRTLLSFRSNSYAAWNVSNGRKLFQRDYPDSLTARHSLVSPDGKHTVVFLAGGDIADVDIMTGRPLRIYRNSWPADTSIAGAFFRSHDTLVFLDFQRRFKVMNILTGDVLDKRQDLLGIRNEKAPDGVVFSPAYQWIAVATKRGDIRLYNSYSTRRSGAAKSGD